MKKIILFTLCFFLAKSTMAQITASGRVIDHDTNIPLAGATIQLLGSSKTIITDGNGTFQIDVPNKNAQIEVSYLGKKSVIINAQPNQIIRLYDSNYVFDEVVVIAYGTSKKADFTGSLSTIKSEDIVNRQVNNVSQLLNSASGIEAVNTTGQPGIPSSIKIRGIGSINADSSPLYIVDGIPFSGQLSTINTSDIESISVLKDAASASLYGSRGANGVVLITTKKGRTKDKPMIDLNARLSANNRIRNDYDVLSTPKDYLETVYSAMHSAAINNLNYPDDVAHAAANQFLPTIQNGGIGYQIYTVPNGEMLIGSDGKLNPNAKLGYSDGKFFYLPDDWQKEAFRTGLRQQYDISISHAKEQSNYYLSFGYLNDEGIIKNSGLERFTTFLKGETMLSSLLKVGVNMSYSITNSKYPSNQTSNYSNRNVFFMANNIAPVYPLYVRNTNGDIMKGIDGRAIYDYGDGISTNRIRSFMPLSNPIADLNYNKETYRLGVYNGRMFAILYPLDGLKLTAQFGMNFDNTRYNRLTNPLYGFAAPKGDVYQHQMETRTLDFLYLADYNKTLFNRHHINLMAGYEGYELRQQTISAQGSNLYLPFVDVVGNTIDQKTGNGYNTKYATASIISRLNYNYGNCYFLSFSYNHNGSSRFNKKHRWGDFYALSGAWVISKEPFLINAKYINFLKLKLSYGKMGNDNINNNYAYIDQYYLQGSNGVFADGNLYYKGNSLLTWEKNTTFNAGVEVELWKGLLSGSLEYFNRKVTDMLFNTPVAPSLGYTSIRKNIGSMTNSGIELNLASQLLQVDNMKLGVWLNATFIKNTINKLQNNEGKVISRDYIYEEGKSMMRMYLVKYAGVDVETGEALYWAKNEKNEEYKTTDWNKANVTNKQASEDFMPTVFGAFGINYKWAAFDLSLQCSYQLGGRTYDEGYRNLMHNGVGTNSGMNWHKDILNAWSPQNNNTDIPRVNLMDQWANAESDRWIISSDYLSLNNLTLGYTLQRNLSHVKIQKIRLFLSAENLAFISARKGLNPCTNLFISTSAVYSPIRSFTGGINITF